MRQLWLASALLLCSAFAQVATAQEFLPVEKPVRSQVQVSGGLGITTFFDNGFLSLETAAHLRTGQRLLTLQTVLDSEFWLMGAPDPIETMWQVNGLYGTVARSRLLQATAAAGLGVMGGVRRGAFLGRTGSNGDWLFDGSISQYQWNNWVTINLPIQASVTLKAMFVGIGLSGGISLNPVHSFGHMAVNLLVGDLL